MLGNVFVNCTFRRRACNQASGRLRSKSSRRPLVLATVALSKLEHSAVTRSSSSSMKRRRTPVQKFVQIESRQF